MKAIVTLYLDDVRDMERLREELVKLRLLRGNIDDFHIAAPYTHNERGRATQLRFAQHATNPNEACVEVWHKGTFVGQITGADACGVRVVTRHSVEPFFISDGVIQIVEVRIGT
jgi:hypothetical protein